MKYLKLFENFEQPEGTGKESSWEREVDGKVIKITLNDVLNYLDNGVEIDPHEIEHLLIDVERDSKRVEASDLDYPIILLSSGGEIKSILDGQHRVVKALENDEMVKIRILDLDLAPEKFNKILNIR
jgi:hypothetical protein